MPNFIKDNIQKTSNNSSRSIKKLLKQRSIVVAFSLLLTGLGASITSISFKTGIYFINNWRLALLEQFPSFLVLPIFGAMGGAIAGSLIKNFAPAAKVLEGVQNLKAKLWICPPTKMDEETLKAEGYYKIFERCGARLELPGCSLCMGNQARVNEGSVVFSTSTRNFDNRLGKNAQVFLGSAELAAVCALLGKIPEVEEYQDITKNKINPYSDELYRYLQFDEIHDFSLTK